MCLIGPLETFRRGRNGIYTHIRKQIEIDEFNHKYRVFQFSLNEKNFPPHNFPPNADSVLNFSTALLLYVKQDSQEMQVRATLNNHNSKILCTQL